MRRFVRLFKRKRTITAYPGLGGSSGKRKVGGGQSINNCGHAPTESVEPA